MEKKRKRKMSSDVLSKDFYANYKSNCKAPLDLKTYNSIIKDYNSIIAQMIVDGFKVQLHKGLSSMYVIEKNRLFRVNSVGDPILPVNWSLTNKLNERDENGKLVRYYVDIEPYYYKVVWFNNYWDDIKGYKFKPCRTITRGIFFKIKEDELIRLKYRSNNPSDPKNISKIIDSQKK